MLHTTLFQLLAVRESPKTRSDRKQPMHQNIFKQTHATPRISDASKTSHAPKQNRPCNTLQGRSLAYLIAFHYVLFPFNIDCTFSKTCIVF